jgi:uncharacterized membrane protein
MHLDGLLRNIVFGIELLGIAIVLIGIVTGFTLFVVSEIRRLLPGTTPTSFITHANRARARIAAYLMLALDLMIGADIINSLMEPDLLVLAQLGGIVAIRTVLSFFLGKELQEIELSEIEKRQLHIIESKS